MWDTALAHLQAHSDAQTPIYVEVHAGTAPTFQALRSQLAALRATGNVRVAVTFRQPFAWAVSAYNYVCGQQKSEAACRPFAKSTNQLFQMGQNPQCSYLLRGWTGFSNKTRPGGYKPVTAEECEQLVHAVQDEVDFVGTTEELDIFLRQVRETLGIPARNHSTHIKKSGSRTNEANGQGLSSRDLTLGDRVQLHTLSLLDTMLVARATKWDQREACFTVGVYQEHSGTQPPYEPVDEWQQCKGRSTWHDWRWMPATLPTSNAGSGGSVIMKDNGWCATAGTAALGVLSRAELCSSLQDANVLIVGDSLSFQTFASLVLRTGDENTAQFSTETNQHASFDQNIAGPVVSLCNHHASVQFIRNDRLFESPHNKNHGTAPFWATAAKKDVLLFNRGAHFEADAKRVVHEMELFAENLKKMPAHQKVFYRTTVPGHPNCMNENDGPWPPTKVASTFGEHANVGCADNHCAVGPPHNWGHIKQRNGMIVQTIQRNAPGIVTYVDAFSLSISRGDRHQSAEDCLHYCLPGPPDTWVDVFALKNNERWHDAALVGSTFNPPSEKNEDMNIESNH
jgi:hypothetical protein